ncbi:MmyB family transcriptional regulator [Paenibacillus tuaregi]|uniref:MmyB family transcriptional regulator n=1 Tax=Paenibacillus tuaregi TaxID=1816681 RepID=UPI0021CBF6F5|nr:hypothetical protein [Paenibacillus tuaregi]
MPSTTRNFVWMTFTSPRFRYIKGDQWELHARRIAAKFHAEYARHADDSWWSGQFEALCEASSEFQEYWDSQEVLDAIDAPKVLQCPNLGILNFDFVSFQVLNDTSLTVSLHVLHQDDTVEKMQRLLSDYQTRNSEHFESFQGI